MKLNYSKIKGWWNTPVNPGKSNNEYDDKSPSQWDVDDFKSYIDDCLDSKNKPTKEILFFGFPNEDLYKYFAENPSGLNSDKYWNKYKNGGGAMYDVFSHLKQRFGTKTENISEYPKRTKQGVQTNTQKNNKKENVKNKMKESITEMIRRVIKEEIGGRYYIAYHERVGGHGEAGTFRDFKSAVLSAKSKIKDKEFMDGLDYVGIEGSNNSLDFAILFVNEFYITRILTKNGFKTPEDYNTFISACKKYIQTGKPQIGKFE